MASGILDFMTLGREQKGGEQSRAEENRGDHSDCQKIRQPTEQFLLRLAEVGLFIISPNYLLISSLLGKETLRQWAP